VFDTVTNTDGGTLLDVAHYILTLRDLSREEQGQFGPSICWKFAVADVASPQQNRIADDGEEYQFWAWTSTKLSPRAKARPYAEALLGRQLAEGEKLNPAELIGRSMKAMIVHETGEDGKVRAKISQEVKPTPFGQAAPAAAKPAANGAAKGDLDIDILQTWGRTIRKAEVLGVPDVARYKAIDPQILGDTELLGHLDALNAAIAAA
jgi:hypothetical protein